MSNPIKIGENVVLKLQDLVYMMYASKTEGSETVTSFLLSCYAENRQYGKIILFTNGVRTLDMSFDYNGYKPTLNGWIELSQKYLVNIQREFVILNDYAEYLMLDWTTKEKLEFIQKHPEMFSLINLRSKQT